MVFNKTLLYFIIILENINCLCYSLLHKLSASGSRVKIGPAVPKISRKKRTVRQADQNCKKKRLLYIYRIVYLPYYRLFIYIKLFTELNNEFTIDFFFRIM